MRTLKAETGGFKASLTGLLVETWHQKKKKKKERNGQEIICSRICNLSNYKSICTYIPL